MDIVNYILNSRAPSFKQGLINTIIDFTFVNFCVWYKMKITNPVNILLTSIRIYYSSGTFLMAWMPLKYNLLLIGLLPLPKIVY